MKALITGATGFIGSHLAEELIARGWTIRCFIRKTSDINWIRDLPAEFIKGDFRDMESLKEAVSHVDYVFHLAGIVRAKDFNDYFRVNFIGTKNLLEACLHEKNIKKFIFMSSQAAAGPSHDGNPVKESDTPVPVSNYGWSKLLAEKELLVHNADIPIVILRPAAVYGPRDRDIYTFFRLVKYGLQPVIGRGENHINLIYVKDLIEGTLMAAEKKTVSGSIYFLAEAKKYSWREVYETISAVMNRKTFVIPVPEIALRSIAVLSGLWAGATGRAALLNREKAEEMLCKYWLCDTSSAQNDLGFRARYPLRRGAEHTVRWYQKQGWL